MLGGMVFETVSLLITYVVVFCPALIYLMSIYPYIYVSFRLVKKSKVKCEGRQLEVSFMLDYNTA